jgi:hypothetical protein
MVITTIIFDSARRTNGTTADASFTFSRGYRNVKKIWLKYFHQPNGYSSANPYDYLLITMIGPFGSAQNPLQPPASVASNNDCTFVIPYRVADTEIVFYESTQYKNKCKGTCDIWNNTIIQVRGQSQVSTTDNWQMFVAVEHDP